MTQPLPLACFIAGCVALAFWLEQQCRWAGKIGATLLVIAFGAVASNTGLVPLHAPIYDVIFGPVTSLAIVWLLFAVNLGDLKKAGPTMLKAFGLALLGTAAGAILTSWLFHAVFPEQYWRLAGTLMGTYSGGSLNFVSVGRALDLPAAYFSATAAADNVVTALWFAATLLLPAVLYRWRKGNITPSPSEPELARDQPLQLNLPFRLTDIAILLALGLGLIWVSQALGNMVPALPEVLILSTLALVMGHFKPVQNLQGAFPLGLLAIHVFFVLIGISSKFSEILTLGLEVFYLTALLVAIHGIVLFGLAAMFRIDQQTTAVASQAAIGGPSTAMAIAISLKRNDLVLPGLVVGLLGYALGTYLGFAVAYLARMLWGG